jgi:hypothetical protein
MGFSVVVKMIYAVQWLASPIYKPTYTDEGPEFQGYQSDLATGNRSLLGVKAFHVHHCRYEYVPADVHDWLRALHKSHPFTVFLRLFAKSCNEPMLTGLSFSKIIGSETRMDYVFLPSVPMLLVKGKHCLCSTWRDMPIGSFEVYQHIGAKGTSLLQFDKW